MTQNAGNLRVRRTEKLLREALIALIEERGFDALTVSEITQRAMVSRAAFYRNYQDKYDLVEQIFGEAMRTLLGKIEDLGPERPPEVWINFFEHIAEYKQLYHALLGRKGSPWFVMKMRASLVEMIRRHEEHPLRLPIADSQIFTDGFLPNILAALFVEAITWWLEQDKPSTPREMATRCAMLGSAIFKEANSLK